jgi:hypothetical protein
MMVRSSEMRFLSATELLFILVRTTSRTTGYRSERSWRGPGNGFLLEMAEFRYQSGLLSALLTFAPYPFFTVTTTVVPGISEPTSSL